MSKEQNYDRTGLNDYSCLETKSVIAFFFVGAILYGCPFLYFTQTKNAIVVLNSVVILESKTLVLGEWYQAPKAKALDSVTTVNNDI